MKKCFSALTQRLEQLVSSRPLGCGCLFFILCCASLLYAPTVIKIVLFAVGLICGGALLFFRKKSFFARFHLIRASVCLILCALSCLCCFICYDLFDRAIEDDARTGKSITIVFYPDEVVYETEYSSLYKATVQSVDGSGVYGVKTLVASERNRLALFERYSLTGVPYFPEGSTPYFDAASYYRTQGIFTVFEGGDGAHDLQDGVSGPAKLLSEMRGAIKNGFSVLADKDTAGILTALMLGSRSDLPDSLKRDFKTLGISHLLAISGLHLSVLYFLLDLLLRRLRVPFKARLVAEMLFVLLYMALCSFSPSVTRAGIMLLLYLTAGLFDRESDSLTSLFLAGAIIVFLSPVSVFNTAFLLSFFACFGILLSGGFFRSAEFARRHRILSRIALPFAVSLFAQTAVLPIVLFTYGSVSLLAPAATLIFSPLISLLLFLAPLCLLFSLIPFLAPAASAIITLPCNFTSFLASFAKYLREMHLTVPLFAAVLFCVSIALFVFIALVLRKKKIGTVVLLLCYLCIGTVIFLLPRLASARVITDVNGKNDIVLTYGKAKSTVIDLSDGSYKHLELCLGLLEEQTGELCPDTLVLTHYHQRHIATLEKLLNRSYLETLCMPEPTEDEREICLALLDKAEKYGVAVVIYSSDDRLDLGCMEFSGFFKDSIKRSTHPILSFTLSYGEDSLRFLSSSSYEKIDAANERTLYFCLHGPVSKSSPPESLTDDKRLLCPDEALCVTLFGNTGALTNALPFVYYFE